jgi:hypothetical protein
MPQQKRLDVQHEASSSVNTIHEPPSRKVPLVAAVAASRRHGFRKEVCRAITLVKGFGVEGDAHGGATVQHLLRRNRASRENENLIATGFRRKPRGEAVPRGF